MFAFERLGRHYSMSSSMGPGTIQEELKYMRDDDDSKVLYTFDSSKCTANWGMPLLRSTQNLGMLREANELI